MHTYFRYNVIIEDNNIVNGGNGTSHFRMSFETSGLGRDHG